MSKQDQIELLKAIGDVRTELYNSDSYLSLHETFGRLVALYAEINPSVLIALLEERKDD